MSNQWIKEMNITPPPVNYTHKTELFTWKNSSDCLTFIKGYQILKRGRVKIVDISNLRALVDLSVTCNGYIEQYTPSSLASECQNVTNPPRQQRLDISDYNR